MEINRNPVSDELVREGLEVAVKARELLWKFSTLQIDKETLLASLQSIPAKETIFNNWDIFSNDEAIAPCLEIFQVIYSLGEDLDYQLSFYGLDSLREDIRQLDAAIKMLRRQVKQYQS
ncbi:MAG: hypothetical protein M0021_07440 [Clostridia bacterium]|nr:hypothetical protein [Clostridia bacterium]